MDKQCPVCRKQFAPARPWQTYCTVSCRRKNPAEKERTRKYQQAKRDLINSVKLQRGCIVCGYNEHAAALDFNHVRGKKLFNVSQDPKVAVQKLLDEIAKCDVICANCHRIHTYENRHWHTKRKKPL